MEFADEVVVNLHLELESFF